MTVRRISRFLSDRRGNILPMFGLTLIPVIGLIGAAVDYSRANSVKAALQAALDSTALAMAAKAPTLNSTDLKTQAQAYFDALFIKYGTTQVPLDVNYQANPPQITVSGQTSVNTMFMRIPGFGINSVTVGGTSTTAWGNTRLRVALALDNTGSMDSSGKMTALKTAAKALIDQLKAAATNDGDVYVSIIPFAKDVNVGTGSNAATWLDWVDWEDSNGDCSGNRYDNSRTACQAAGRTWTPDSHSTWTGCVKDRDQPYNTTNDAPTNSATRFPTEQYSDCPVALMPLSYNWAGLKTKIDSMSANGNTNTTIGLEWGWHSLSQNAPLNAPAEDTKYQYNKVIIFMTDGTNTQDRYDTSSYDGSTQQQNIDNRFKTACTNAKNAGMTIYTIQMIDGNSQLLKDCASSSDKYFKITSSSQTVSVFTQIGTNLSRLRVAK